MNAFVNATPHLLPRRPDRPIEQDPGIADFAAILLLALTRTAARNRRGQADLAASMQHAELSANSPRVAAALRVLEAQGCVSNLVPMSGGGMLLTVTGRPMGRVAAEAIG
jgi:hypothetical protein